MTPLTPNQIRILTQLAKGGVPTSMNPKQSMDALEQRGLVVYVEGQYPVNATSDPSYRPHVWRLTPAGVVALEQEAHRKCEAGIRKARQEESKTLRMLARAPLERS